MPPGPKWKDEREPDGEPGGADELSIEERILAEKARAAAAKREAERRGQAQEVSDFLDGILAPAREEPPEGPAGPGVGAVLAAEPGDRGPDAAFAPFAGAAGPAAPGPALSESLAATYLELQALGREGEGLPRLSFEAGEPPAEPGPNIAPPEPPPRRYLALTFEPEGAAAAAAQEEEQKSKAATRHLSPPDILPGDQGTGAAQSPPAAAAPAQEPRAPDGAQYSLDDLPAVPAAEPPQEPSERSFEIEPAMDDSSDDEARLREALAAAEAAARATTLGELKAVPEAGAEPGRGPAAGPAARQYSIEDLPEAPGGAPRAQPDEPERPPSGDDRLPEEKLPALAVPPQAAAPQPSPPPPPPPAGRAPAGAPVPPPVAAENAADLSAQQLADMERYIVSQVDAEPGRPRAVGRESPGPRRPAALLRLATAAKQGAAGAIRILDRLLEPYCLSCKRLLGIAGVLILAGMAAYILKTWVLPGMPRGQ